MRHVTIKVVARFRVGCFDAKQPDISFFNRELFASLDERSGQLTADMAALLFRLPARSLRRQQELDWGLPR